MSIFTRLFCYVVICFHFTYGGCIITSSHQDLTDENQNAMSKITLSPGKVRLETTGISKSEGLFIYRQDKDICFIINQTDKNYLQMTRQDLQSMTNTISEVMKQMESQISALPPEQRAIAESMMKNSINNQSAVQYKKVESNLKIGNWTCDKYIGVLNNVKTVEVWVTDWKNLGIQKSEYDALASMAQFFSQFAKKIGDFFKPGFGTDKSGYEGLPIKMITYVSGKPAFETNVKEIKMVSPDESLFSVPDGFTKRAIPFGTGK